MDDALKTEKLRIGGMTCMHCQNIIEKNLKNTDGVQNVAVSYKAGTATITYKTDVVSIEKIRSIIEETGYVVLPANSANGISESNIHRVAGFLISIAALYMLLDYFGVLNVLVPSQLADSRLGYGMLFVIGLITSVHCIAMCGGINLSQSIPLPQESAQNENQSKISAFIPAFMYNSGRVVSYTAIGFVLGFVGMLFGGDGSNVGLSVTTQGTLKLVAGVFMVIMGINMLNIFPWMRSIIPGMPKIFNGKINIGKKTPAGVRPLIVGLLNGFMPCGPLQSMQIVALVSANPLAGAFSMFLFSLGTVPLMLGLGSVVSALGRKFTANVMAIGATLVVVLGLAMLSQGTSLSGIMPSDMLTVLIVALCVIGIVSGVPYKKQYFKIASVSVSFLAAVIVLIAFHHVNVGAAPVSASNSGAAKKETAKSASKVQIINSTLYPNRYPNITVQAGTPVKWIIDAPQGSINGCNDRINIREYGIMNYKFKYGENVIEFTPTQTGRVQYSCWMGMIRGTITVVDSEAGAKNQNAETFFPIDPPAINKPKPSGVKISAEKLAIAKIIDGLQEVTINISDSGISPAVVVMQTGINTKWIINNTSDDISHYTLLFPAYNMQVPLKKGENPLGIRPTDSFPFSTSNNAHYGYLKAVGDIAAIDTNAIKAEARNIETLIYPPETFGSGRGGGARCH
ncbi:MAG: sulfite exporter TauE/SafE family protein [Chitinivibrionia bacterium]|nr:sulfite exporter TauE/SafE family protein [Chitinivibrionia bacterium]